MSISLRPYQIEARDAVLSSTEKSVAVALPTGTGKTHTAKAMIDVLVAQGRRVIFTVPSVELMFQSGRSFGCHNYLGGGRKPNWSGRLMIATVQSLAGRLDKLRSSGYDVLIVDEAHHAIADSYVSVIGAIDWHKVICLSATMFRADGRRLKDVVEKVVYEKDIHWAIAEGYLSPYRLIRPSSAGSLPLTSETCLVKRKDGSEKTLDRMSFDHEARNILVRDLVRRLFDQHARKSAIMFVNTVDHARKLAEIMGPEWGWCSADYRSDLERFRRGELKGIISVQLILEGFDYPPADFLIVNGNIKATAGGGRQSRATGLIRWIQLLGRVLRLSPGKKYAIALDLSVHGLPDIQYQSDLNGMDKEPEDDTEDPEIESMEVIERLEHPMLVTLDDLIQGLRQVNQEYRRHQNTLATRMKLLQKGDIYTVVGTSWRMWQAGSMWRATDGQQEIEAQTVAELESHIQPTEYRVSSKIGPTENQIRLLQKLKVSDQTIAGMNRKQASDYLGKLLAERNVEPATPKQLKFLKWKRIAVPENLSKQQATRLIAGAVK